MKWLFIALPFILLMYIIGSNELSSNIIIYEKQKVSYEACDKLRRKAPYFNLKCEKLLDNIPIPEPKNKNEANNTKFKTLSKLDTTTRKVNKIEEKKLRILMQKLSYENNLRKD